MPIETNTTYKDVFGGLWVVTTLFYAALDSPEVVAISLYKVGTYKKVQFVEVKEFSELIRKEKFELIKTG